jgi:NAD-dependent dihydropyrimidine dehydrogenase PreA subunit
LPTRIKEEIMPFKITPDCSGKDTICEDVCAYNCVKTSEEADEQGSRHFQIDPEQCTDCGACALACPEAAIVYAHYTRHQARHEASASHAVPVVTSEAESSNGGATGQQADPEIEIPEGFLVLNGKVESWARLMAASVD